MHFLRVRILVTVLWASVTPSDHALSMKALYANFVLSLEQKSSDSSITVSLLNFVCSNLDIQCLVSCALYLTLAVYFVFICIVEPSPLIG